MASFMVIPYHLSLRAYLLLTKHEAFDVSYETKTKGFRRINFDYDDQFPEETFVEEMLDLADEFAVNHIYVSMHGPVARKNKPCSHNWMKYHQGKFVCDVCGVEVEVEN